MEIGDFDSWRSFLTSRKEGPQAGNSFVGFLALKASLEDHIATLSVPRARSINKLCSLWLVDVATGCLRCCVMVFVSTCPWEATTALTDVDFPDFSFG